jgi:hypothetical protein
MTLYYVKQDNTVWGCGDPGCCGEYYEEIDEEFVDCTCEVEVDSDHLHACNSGGPVLDWRRATPLEAIAYESGVTNGYWVAFEAGIEFQKKETSKGTDK